MNKIHCKYHRNATLILDSYVGDLICSVCGLVVVERAIDPSQEWINKDGDGPDDCRVGKVETSHTDGQTSITIQQSFNLKHLDENGKSKFAFHSAADNKESSMKLRIKELTGMCNTINLDANTLSGAISLLHEINKAKLSFKRNKSAINCVCLYLACIDGNIPRTPKEILNDIFNVTDKEFKKVLKMIQLGLKRKIVIVKPEQYVSRFIFNLGIRNMKLEKLAIQVIIIAKNVEEIKSKGSVIIAMSCIQMACNLLYIFVDTGKYAEHLGYSRASIIKMTKVLENHIHKDREDLQSFLK